VRLAVLVAAVACVAAVLAGTASATNECKGLQVCVPVAGPWVVTQAGSQVQFELKCPSRFVIGGLDAELSSKQIDVGFVGTMGSPVNPGITTSDSALFLGRFVGAKSHGASFRPHIGCIPASGGGQRVPTAFHPFPPGKPSVRVAQELPVRHGTARLVSTCDAPERLSDASYAVAFFTPSPPTEAQAASVSVQQTVHSGRVLTIAHGAPSLGAARAIVQVDLVCAAGT
jgi:hypothetical protein